MARFPQTTCPKDLTATSMCVKFLLGVSLVVSTTYWPVCHRTLESCDVDSGGGGSFGRHERTSIYVNAKVAWPARSFNSGERRQEQLRGRLVVGGLLHSFVLELIHSLVCSRNAFAAYHFSLLPPPTLPSASVGRRTRESG